MESYRKVKDTTPENASSISSTPSKFFSGHITPPSTPISNPLNLGSGCFDPTSSYEKLSSLAKDSTPVKDLTDVGDGVNEDVSDIDDLAFSIIIMTLQRKEFGFTAVDENDLLHITALGAGNEVGRS
ncbi:6803_t:CDS:2, partial [Acaulospora morrowiae]